MATRGTAADHRFVQVHSAGDLLEQFFVSAIVAVLGIRIYLAATGYPQIGGGDLHIAHMLWGGLLMLVALVLALTFLGRRVRSAVAVIGGLGFGTFIDELGKFITADNDYFYQPAWVILYLLFVGLFFAFTALSRRRHPTGAPALATALDLAQDGVLHGLRQQDRRAILRLLEDSGPDLPLAQALRRTVPEMRSTDECSPGIVDRVQARLSRWYEVLVGNRGFRGLLLLVWIGITVAALIELTDEIVRDPRFTATSPSLSVMDGLQGAAVLISTALAAIGLISLAHSRLVAFGWFRWAILVSLVLGQPFAFYENEIFATGGLLIDLVCLAVFDYALSLERARRQTTGQVGRDERPGFFTLAGGSLLRRRSGRRHGGKPGAPVRG